jgi:hypothetical protein
VTASEPRVRARTQGGRDLVNRKSRLWKALAFAGAAGVALLSQTAEPALAHDSAYCYHGIHYETSGGNSWRVVYHQYTTGNHHYHYYWHEVRDDFGVYQRAHFVEVICPAHPK